MATVVTVIRCGGFANDRPCPVLGQYLKSFDPDGDPERGLSVWTPDIQQAQRFKTAGEAFRFWKQVRKSEPVRPDGKPNRPLTAFNVMFEPLSVP